MTNLRIFIATVALVLISSAAAVGAQPKIVTDALSSAEWMSKALISYLRSAEHRPMPQDFELAECLEEFQSVVIHASSAKTEGTYIGTHSLKPSPIPPGAHHHIDQPCRVGFSTDDPGAVSQSARRIAGSWGGCWPASLTRLPGSEEPCILEGERRRLRGINSPWVITTGPGPRRSRP